MSINIYRCSPRQVRRFAVEIMEAGLVPFIQSSPGMGKSSILRSIADEANLLMIDHRLSTSAPEDLSGLPRFDDNGFAYFAPFAELFPLEGMALPKKFDETGKLIKEYNGWLLNLDEFNSASKSVQAAGYKLILDRMTGQRRLHDAVAMACAGNLSTDRAITNPLGTAMQSRLIHLEMEINHQEWMEDVALAQNYDSRIIAYLSQYPSKLMDFRPDHQEKTFCCPRTWEFTNKLIRGKELTDDYAPLLSGTITSGVAVEFIQFTKIFKNMITVNDIVKDPFGCVVPMDNSTKWAVVTHLMEKLDNDNFTPIADYIARFDIPFRILFFRSMLIRNPQMRQHPAFIKAMSTMAKYLNGA